MTDREEVIKQLKKLKSFHNGSYGEAINFAIESIKVDLAYDLAYEKTESDRKKEPCDDYISRADVIKALEYSLSIEADGGLDKYRTVIKDLLDAIYDTQKKAIEDLPSIQPKAESDRKKGHWIVDIINGKALYSCSCCWRAITYEWGYHYCPACGTKLEGVIEND